jgi:hypothetical protein
MIVEFSCAVEFCAASLGVVTHAANNHTVTVVRHDGKVVNRKVRDNNADQAREHARVKRQGQDILPDSARPQKCAKGESSSSSTCDKALHVNNLAPYQPPVQKHNVAISKARANAKAKVLEARNESSFRDHWRSRLDARKTTQPVVSGAEKLAALKGRIRDRSEA